MVIDYSSLVRAFEQLEKSLEYLNSEMSQKDSELRLQFRAATVQAFEFTYELLIKMIRRQLEQIVANPAELRQMAFMDMMRSATDAGLIREAVPFKIYREKRNITSHTYNSHVAEGVISVIDEFLKDTRFVLEELKRRNPPEENDAAS